MTLAAELVNLRMVPIDRVLQRAFRAGRSVAVASRKNVEIKVVGHGLMIDKSLADAISDPLIHLVRNAVDNGIENELQRVGAGKNAQGKISIEATTLQGQTRIRVTDDGRGINPEFICTAGRNLGVVSDDKQLDMEQSVRLLPFRVFNDGRCIRNLWTRCRTRCC
jgi:two-component system chemotaxis sensor kinase CheA